VTCHDVNGDAEETQPYKRYHQSRGMTRDSLFTSGPFVNKTDNGPPNLVLHRMIDKYAIHVDL
jgi:hypothetical protein